MPMEEINEIKDKFVQELDPLRIYLFGSFADGSENEDSDFDFYIVVEDNAKNIADLTVEAYRCIRRIKKRPVDIIVATESRFNERRKLYTVENEVDNKGVLLYGKSVIIKNNSPGGFPKKHDLSFLLNQIKNIVDISDELYDCADILTPYGVVVRYPGELFLEERHAQAAIKSAETILDWAKNNL